MCIRDRRSGPGRTFPPGSFSPTLLLQNDLFLSTWLLMVKVWFLMCLFQIRVNLGPPELAVSEKMGFGGKHLGRRTDREMPAGKAGFREFGTAEVFSQRPIALTIDQRSRRPASANCRAGSADPAIKPPVPTGGRHKARPTKFFNVKIPESKIQREKPSAVGRRRKGGSVRPATGGAEVALRRSGFPQWMGRLFQPKTQTQNSEPGAGSGFGAGIEAEVGADEAAGDRRAQDRAVGVRLERLPGVRRGGIGKGVGASGGADLQIDRPGGGRRNLGRGDRPRRAPVVLGKRLFEEELHAGAGAAHAEVKVMGLVLERDEASGFTLGCGHADRCSRGEVCVLLAVADERRIAPATHGDVARLQGERPRLFREAEPALVRGPQEVPYRLERRPVEFVAPGEVAGERHGLRRRG